MARPKSKDELTKMSNENFDELMSYIMKMSTDEREAVFPPGTMNRNIRDVLTHLHQWHEMMLEWYRVGISGQKPIMPAVGFSWKETPQLNKKIWEDYQNTSLNDGIDMLKESFVKIQQIIANHSDEELFEKKRYKWTGTTSLGTYLVSNSSSHYAWALKLIKKARK